MFEFNFIGIEDNYFTSNAFARFVDTILYAEQSGISIHFSIIGNPISDAGSFSRTITSRSWRRSRRWTSRDAC